MVSSSLHLIDEQTHVSLTDLHSFAHLVLKLIEFPHLPVSIVSQHIFALSGPHSLEIAESFWPVEIAKIWMAEKFERDVDDEERDTHYSKYEGDKDDVKF